MSSGTKTIKYRTVLVIVNIRIQWS